MNMQRLSNINWTRIGRFNYTYHNFHCVERLTHDLIYQFIPENYQK